MLGKCIVAETNFLCCEEKRSIVQISDQEDSQLQRPTKVNYSNGAPGWILTTDLPLRRRTLYTAELRERQKQFSCRSRSGF